MMPTMHALCARLTAGSYDRDDQTAPMPTRLVKLAKFVMRH